MKTKNKVTKILFSIFLLTVLSISNVVLFPTNYTEAATVTLSKAPKILLIGSWKMANGTIMKFDSKGVWSMTEPKAATYSLKYEVVTVPKKFNCINIYVLDKNNKRGDYISAQFTSDNNMILGSDKLTRITTTASVSNFKIPSAALPIALLSSKRPNWKSSNGMCFKFSNDLTATISGIPSISEDGEGSAMWFNFTYSIPPKSINTIVLNMSNVNYEYKVTVVFTDDDHALISAIEAHSSTYTFKNVKFTRSAK